MKKLPLIIFFLLAASAVFTSLHSLRQTERMIALDLDNALEMTMREMSVTKIDADTLSVYRNYISIAEVRDTAGLVLKGELRKENGVLETVIKAEPGCSFATMFSLSDQRLSFILSLLAAIWLFVTAFLNGRRRETSSQETSFHLTPMQEQLMDLFKNADGRVLTKQEICEALWPKKPDASDTLYTLIRRLKPILEKKNMRIESDRGRGYRLIISGN